MTVETPCKQVQEYYHLLGMEVQAHVKIDAFIDDVMNIKCSSTFAFI